MNKIIIALYLFVFSISFNDFASASERDYLLQRIADTEKSQYAKACNEMKL